MNPWYDLIQQRGVKLPQVGGPVGPRQQAPQGPNPIWDTLLQTGLGMMARSSQPGATGFSTFGQSMLSEGLPAGEAAKKRREWEAMLVNAPPEMRQVLNHLGPDRGAMVLAQRLMTPQAEEEAYTLAPGARRFVGDREVAANPVAQESPKPMEWPDARSQREAFALFGPGITPDQLTQEQWAAIDDSIDTDATDVARAGVVTGQDYGEIKGRISASYDNARKAVQTIQRVDRAIEIAEDPQFAEVAGAGASFVEQAQRVFERMGAPESEALELAAEYQALVGTLAVEQLQMFGAGSGLSDRDLAEAKALVGANKNLTPAQLRAILRVVRGANEEVVAGHDDALRRGARLGIADEWLEFFRTGTKDDLYSTFGITRVRGPGG